MRAKLTKRAIDAASPEDKDSFLWDSEVKGFGLKVTPLGKRVYIIQYRIGRRLRRYTIGTHGSPWTPDEARREAQRLLRMVDSGTDPADAKSADKAVPTFAAAAARFLDEHVELKTKSRTIGEYRRLLDTIILPTFGNRRISEIERAAVGELHHKLRRTPYQANRVLALLSKLFNWAEGCSLRNDGSNPCRHVEKFREQKRERFLSEAELARLGDVLEEEDRAGGTSRAANAALRLLVFTGARMNEILTLRWAHVDLERSVLRLPDSKTGAKLIHLSPPAASLLSAVPRIEGNPYVIAGEKPGHHFVNLEKTWRRVRAKAGLEDVRLHDLRHSFASAGAAAGLSLPVIGALLGHSDAATTARYAHLGNDPVRQANDMIGRQLAAALGGAQPEEAANAD